MPRAIISEEEFFRRCYEKHGNKYDYSNIKYIGMGRRIHGIICKKHKIIFSQFASDHAIGKTGCKNCVAEARRLAFQLGNDEFKKRAHKRFGDLFDLSMIKYVNKREKVIIVCKKHGEVLVSPEDFLANEHGCPRCGNAASQANGKGYYSIYKAASRHFLWPWKSIFY